MLKAECSLVTCRTSINSAPEIQSTFQSQQGLAIMQTQTIYMQINEGQIHLSCNEQQIKCIIPITEWYIIMRQLRSLVPFIWMDSKNKSKAYFSPFINMGIFEVAIELSFQQ